MTKGCNHFTFYEYTTLNTDLMYHKKYVKLIYVGLKASEHRQFDNSICYAWDFWC